MQSWFGEVKERYWVVDQSQWVSRSDRSAEPQSRAQAKIPTIQGAMQAVATTVVAIVKIARTKQTTKSSRKSKIGRPKPRNDDCRH
jgi:hypothetical protein